MSSPRTLLILVWLIASGVIWLVVEFGVDFREFFFGALGGLVPDILPAADIGRLRQGMATAFGAGLLLLLLLRR